MTIEDRLCSAWLGRDRQLLLNLLGETRVPRWRTTAKALLACLAVEEDDTLPGHAQHQLEQALEALPDHAEGDVLLPLVAGRIAVHLDQPGLARLIAAHLDHSRLLDHHRSLSGQTTIVRALAALAEGDCRTAAELSAARLPSGESLGATRLTLWQIQAESTLELGWHESAAQTIARFCREAPAWPGPAWRGVHLRLRLAIAQGRLTEAERILRGNAGTPAALPSHLVRLVRLELALASGRLEEARVHAEDLIAAWPTLEPFNFLGLAYHHLGRAREFLLRQRYEVALGQARHASSALSQVPDPLLRLPVTRSLAEVVLGCRLAMGDRLRVRMLLHHHDPNGTGPRFDAAWMRLHLLENDVPAAAPHFRRIRDLGGERLVEQVLEQAPEVRAGQVARLFHAAAALPPAVAAGLIEPVESILAGRSQAARQIRVTIDDAARNRRQVLISGPAGSGRRLAARMIHDKGQHADLPRAELSCPSIPPRLLGWLLCGQGETPGLLAESGTIILTGVEQLSHDLQQSLQTILTQRHLPTGRVLKARLIATGEIPGILLLPHELIELLGQIRISCPALSDRREDIRPILGVALNRLGCDRADWLHPDLLNHLERAPWPDHVAGLLDALERIITWDREWESAGSRLRPLPASTIERQRDDPEILPLPGTARSRRRRRELLKLFRRETRLNRIRVAHLLGCCTRTAATDLAALAEAGLIRRMHGSGHLRETYYIRV